MGLEGRAEGYVFPFFLLLPLSPSCLPLLSPFLSFILSATGNFPLHLLPFFLPPPFPSLSPLTLTPFQVVLTDVPITRKEIRYIAERRDTEEEEEEREGEGEREGGEDKEGGEGTQGGVALGQGGRREGGDLGRTEGREGGGRETVVRPKCRITQFASDNRAGIDSTLHRISRIVNRNYQTVLSSLLPPPSPNPVR
jgi:hypothetical protein